MLLLDIRQPSVPVAELSRHHGSVNALAWAPHSPDHMCTAGDDCQALIWDLQGAVAGDTVCGGQHPPCVRCSSCVAQDVDPILAYDAGQPISQLSWSATQPDWVAVCMGSRLQVLRV